ncbi:MAG: DUF4845 domain-containing protein [Pseudomonadota bacterium]
MRHRQRGEGVIGVALLVVVIGFAVIIGLKLTPIYLEYMAVKRAIVNTAQSPELKNATVNELRKSIERRFEVDNVKAITPADVDITKEGGRPVLSASYSVKVPLVSNVNLCIDFNTSSDK